MLDILMHMPDQLRRAQAIGNTFKIPHGFKNFTSVVFLGVGGSAIGGDVIKSYLDTGSTVPIEVNRSYALPGFVNKHTLIFACSYSGNTEETLSAYKLAKKRGAKIISITSGGRLSELSLRDSTPCILLPKGMPPRTAIGYMVIIPHIALAKLKLTQRSDKAIRAAMDLLTSLRDKHLKPDIPKSKNMARKIASALHKKFVVVYGSSGSVSESAAVRWKQDLNENSKAPAASHLFPEMNHNEIT